MSIGSGSHVATAAQATAPAPTDSVGDRDFSVGFFPDDVKVGRRCPCWVGEWVGGIGYEHVFKLSVVKFNRWLTSCKSAGLASRKKNLRREPGRDGKILCDRRQDGNDEINRLSEIFFFFKNVVGVSSYQ